MSIELYTDYFGFRERPFTLLPDPSMMFWSRQHAKAYTVLEYGLTTKSPITVVTGEVGTGKTTLIRVLLSNVEPEATIGLISNVQGGRGDLLRWVLNALDVPTAGLTDYVELFQSFQDYVIEEYAAGRHVVLIIDEAQNLGPDLLEELRMLTNMNSGKDTLLQLVLLGQPELRDMISHPSLRQFAQRISASFHINPMDEDTTCEYITSRLQLSGGTGEEIAPHVLKRIFHLSDGVPRLVNKICDLALVYAASADRKQVDTEIMDELIEDDLIVAKPRTPLVLSNQINPSKGATK